MRVLVVDDAAAYRRIVARALGAIAGVVVAGEVADVASAQRRVATGDIDAVTVDVNLRDESGLDLVRWIHRHAPGVVTVLVTAGQTQGARTEVDALLAGAAGLILKPENNAGVQPLESALRALLQGVGDAQAPVVARTQTTRARREVIAVGASTGGPPVLLTFLRGLPTAFEIPIIIVQHMPALHVPYLAETLAAQSGRPVRVAADGEVVNPGITYLAGHALHLKVTRDREGLRLLHANGEPEHHCRPAIDPLFRSVAAVCGSAAIGVVMTGLGSDGTRGALDLTACGAPVVVQDRRTSVAWNMPNAVIQAGAATAVLPADALAGWVARHAAPILGQCIREVT